MFSIACRGTGWGNLAIVFFPAYYWTFFRVSFILKPANCFNQSIGHLCDKDRPLDPSPSKEGKKSMKNLAVSLCALAVSLFGGMTVDAQITTVAGGGPPTTGTTVNKTGTSIGAPAAVRQDHLGNTYILDNDLGRVFKVDAMGHLTLFAGNGTVGYNGDNIPAVSAAMDGPSGLCIDANNNVYTADSDNAIVREVVVATGMIHTVAGMPMETNFTYGGDGGARHQCQPPLPGWLLVRQSRKPVHRRPRQQRHSYRDSRHPDCCLSYGGQYLSLCWRKPRC